MIEPNEWKQFFFLYNIYDPIELLHHWRYSSVNLKNMKFINFAESY
jgi:hypothetical protein